MVKSVLVHGLDMTSYGGRTETCRRIIGKKLPPGSFDILHQFLGSLGVVLVGVLEGIYQEQELNSFVRQCNHL
jgi:hypothetical protein